MIFSSLETVAQDLLEGLFFVLPPVIFAFGFGADLTDWSTETPFNLSRFVKRNLN